jgi:D-glycero-D-manno-heptose 1,7-bisphosphate phosphatase
MSYASAELRPLIILDRDGVINHDSDQYIKTPDEWEPISGSVEAIAELCHEGWQVFVATNQSGLARGLFDLPTLHAIHRKMNDAIEEAGGELAGIFFCPHGPDAGCLCRKPAPGLLQDISRRLGRPLSGVPVVGDSLRDLTAAQMVGAQPCLVLTGKGQKTLAAQDSKPLPPGTLIFDDLAAAGEHLRQSPQKA